MITRHFKLCLFLCLFVLTVGCNSAENYFSVAQAESSAGNYVSAIRNFERALNENPFLKDAYILKGQCHEYLNQYDTAIQEFEKLLHIDPNNTAAFYYSGVCLYRQNKIREAISYYNKALESKGGFDISDTNSIQAVLDLNKDDFETDEADFSIPSREILYDRALAYYKTGQLKNACIDFRNCIIQNYNPGTSYYMIGMCSLAKNKRKQALEAFHLASSYGDSLGRRELSMVRR
jgi:tetratricopeptide (TPR) repeat protein